MVTRDPTVTACFGAMDVIDAVNTRCSEFLRDKFKQAVDRVARTIELYGAPAIAFSFNGGKDSTVLLHVIRAAVESLRQKQLEQEGGNGVASGQLEGSMGGMHVFFFARKDDFPELDAFVREADVTYGLGMQVFDGDFRGVLEGYVRDTGVRAIILGTRRGDPNAGGQEVWCPSSPGWPPFMRVNPVLDWSYRDVWDFLMGVRLPYCSLYNTGYTSLGGTQNTVQNSALQRPDGSYAPAHMLSDGRLERAGRASKLQSTSSAGALRSGNAALAIVGDEILSGKVEDANTNFLCQQLHCMGWKVTRVAVLPDDVSSISAELRAMLKENDVVITAGGVGPTLDDVTMAAVADALRVPLVRNPDMEQCITQHFQGQLTEAHLKMAEAPEGQCELIHYKREDGLASPFPLMLCGARVYVLPGVPHLLRQKWKAVRQHLEPRASCAPFRSVALRLDVGDEAAVAPSLDRLAEQVGSGVAIGSYPVDGQADGRTRLVVSLESKDVELLKKARDALLQGLPQKSLVAEEWDAPTLSRENSLTK